MISGTIGLVNYNPNSKFNSPFLTPSSYFVRTINGVRRTTVYYDSDLFDDLIILSVSLLIGSDDIPFHYHYNTVHDEDTGTSGTAWKALEEIAIPIYPRPKRTKIIGQRRMDVGSILEYHIPADYDVGDNFTYDWYLTGDAGFPDNGNSDEYLDAGKSVNIKFNSTDTITLKLKITNPGGCFRYIIRNLYPGTATKKLMVVRYPYY